MESGRTTLWSEFNTLGEVDVTFGGPEGRWLIDLFCSDRVQKVGSNVHPAKLQGCLRMDQVTGTQNRADHGVFNG